MAYKFNPFTGKIDSYGPVLTGTGTVSAAADGSAAFPGIAFASDLDTGLFRTAVNSLSVATGGTERLRINSSGSHQAFSDNDVFRAASANPNNANFGFYYGYHSATHTQNGTLSYFVGCNGTVLNGTGTYGQITSDERFKQDIVDANSQWDDIKNIRITNYRWKSDPTGVPLLGPIAQELQVVSPGLITTRTADKTDEAASGGLVSEGDEVLGVKNSILYMKAVKALQEAMNRIETLEAKVTALENP